jgi:hypothetical protein
LGDWKSILEVNKFRHHIAYFRINEGEWNANLKGRYFKSWDAVAHTASEYLRNQTQDDLLYERAKMVDSELLPLKKEELV